jgi:hypothetical protein
MTEEEFKDLVRSRDFRAERTLVRAHGEANALAGYPEACSPGEPWPK